MKKNVILSAIFMSVLLLVACSNASYDEAMENAEQAIEEKAYEKAITYFETAIEEKKKDEIAPFKLKQTELFVEGLARIDAGELSEAEEVFQALGDTEDEEAFLHEDAAEQLEVIVELETAYGELEAGLKKAEKLREDQEYDAALEEVGALLKDAFSHAYLQAIQDELKALEEAVEVDMQVEEERAQMKKGLKEAKALSEEKSYADAIALIETTLESKVSKDVKEEFAADFEALSKEYAEQIEAEKKAKAKKEKAEKELQGVFGYYQHIDFPNDFFYLDPTYIVNYVYASDVGFATNVKKYELEAEYIVATMDDGNTFSLEYSDNRLLTIQGIYTKVSKAEIKETYPEVDFNDFKKENIPDWLWDL